MTSGNEQRRKRRSDSFRRDEADEADNWLAGLRGSGPDPFSPPPPSFESFDEPAPFDEGPRRPGRSRADDSPSGTFRGPRDDSPSGVFRGGPRDESPSGSFRAPRDDSPSGSFRAPRDESPSGSFRAPRDDSPSGSFRAPRGGRDDSPSGTFPRPVLPPGRSPADPRPAGDPRLGPDGSAAGGRRRARGDDSPSGTFRAPRGDSTGSRPARDDSPSGTFRAPRDESPSGSFRAPREEPTSFRAPRDDSPSGSFRAPRGDSTGSRPARDDSPSGVFRAAPRDEASSGSFRPLRDDSPGGAFRPGRDDATSFRPARDDSPSGVFGRTAPPPARAAIEPPPSVDAPESRGGRRRARAEDEPTGRRALEGRPAEPYGHVPALEPIIKPLADYTPRQAAAEPPPLVPIFPTIRPESSPTSGASTGRRARRAAEEPDDTSAPQRFDEPNAPRGRRARADSPDADTTGSTRTGDVGRSRRGPAETPAAGRRARNDADERGFEATGTTSAALDTGTGTGRRAARSTEDPTGFRRDDTGTSRRGRGGFESTGPETGIGRQRSGSGSGGGPATGSGFASGSAPAGPGAPGAPGSGPNGFAGPASGTGGPGPGADRGGPRTGDTGIGRRGGFYPGGPDDTTGSRRDDTGTSRRDDTGIRRNETGPRRDDTGTARRGRNGFEADTGLPPVRRDDTGTARRRRDGFEPTGPGYDPAGAAFEMTGTATRRRPTGEAPQQRRPLDDVPFDALEGTGTTTRRGRGRGTGTGDYTTGGTERALREPPGKRPAGGRPTKPGTAVIDPVRVEHRPHRWIAALSVIGVVVLLAACGLGSWFIFKDEKNGPESARSSATAGPKKRDISSRQVDPAALTEAEVFPQNNIVAVVNEPPYVILKTHTSPDCKTAATDDLATLLAGAGCTEVVRATMKSPNEEYLITAGIFNLDTEKAAAQAFDGVKPIVDGQKGRFAGMSVGAGTGTDAIVRAPTQLGWNYRGHFIAFCVIARVDGKEFTPDDAYPNQITYDIVEMYLENGIIGNRAIIQPEATPAASLPAAPPS